MTTPKPTRIRFSELDEQLQLMLFQLATHVHKDNIIYPATQEDFYELSTDSDPGNNPAPGQGRIRFVDLDLSGSPALQNLLSGGISSIPASITGEILKHLGGSATAPNGIQTQYECLYQVFPNSETVFIQGVRQQRGVDYNVTGNVITFTTAPPANPIDPTRPILIDYEPMSPAVPMVLPRYLISEFPVLVGVSTARTYSLSLSPIQEGLDTGGNLTQIAANIQTPLVTEQVYHLGDRLVRGTTPTDDYTVNTIGSVRNIAVNNVYSSAIIVDYQPAGATSNLSLYTNARTSGTIPLTYIAPNQVKIDKSGLGITLYDFDTNSIQVYYNGKRLRAGVALDYTVSYTSGSNDLFINFNPSVSPAITSIGAANNLIVDFQTQVPALSVTYKYFTRSHIVGKPVPAANIDLYLSVPSGVTLVGTISKQPQVFVQGYGRLKNDLSLYTVDIPNKKITLLAAAIPTLFPGSTTQIKVIVDYQVTVP